MRMTRRTASVAAAWTAVGVLGAAALTGVATAAPGSAPAADTRSSAATTADGPADQARHRHLGGRVLHGEFTVKGKDGYRQAATQLGTVSALDKESITVRSEDGTTWTWALTGDTRVRTGRAGATLGDVKSGATVRVAGPTDDGKRTARLVVIRPGGSTAQPS